MDGFKEKSVDELLEWLKKSNFSENVIQTFREEEIDGEAFVLMSADDIVSMVKSRGAQLKIAEKKRQLSLNYPALETKVSFLLKQPETGAKRCLTLTDNDLDTEVEQVAKRGTGAKCGLTLTDYDLDTEDEHVAKRRKQDAEKFATYCPEDQEESWNYSSEEGANVEDVEHSFTGESQEVDVVDTPPSIVKKADAPVKCVAQLKRVTQRHQEPPLPNPFPLPKNFPPVVALAMKEKKLTSKSRAKFVTTLANAIFMLKSYPTSRELEDVSRAAMKEWEFLGSKSGFDWLVEALRERLKYFRRNKSVQCPMPETKRAAQRKPVKQQMPHMSTLPPTLQDVGEDEASHDRHVKILALEWKKSKPNRHSVGELMRRTFGVRRQKILSSQVSLDCLLQCYPPLQQYRELAAELDRIMDNGVSQQIKEGWEEMISKIIIVAEEEQDNPTIEALLSTAPDKMSNDARSILAAILLYHLMPDTKSTVNHHRIVCLVPDTTTPRDAGAEMCTAQPCVVVRGSLEDVKDAFLVIEKRIICRVPPIELPLALLATFYTFNLHYPQGCTNFYTFFECLFLGKKIPYKKTRLSCMITRIENIQD